LISKKPGIVHIHVGSAGGKIGMLFDIVKNTNIPISQFRPTHLSNFIDEAADFIKLGGYVDCTSGRSPERAAKHIVELSKEASIEYITLSSDSNGSLPVWNENKEITGLTAAKMTTLHATVRCLVNDFGFPLEKAISVCTSNVAKSLGLFPRKGCLGIGSDADITILDKSLNVSSVFCKGRLMMHEGVLLVKGHFE
jgi:beta-aspartyl-dipeptidase (metallo-type)